MGRGRLPNASRPCVAEKGRPNVLQQAKCHSMLACWGDLVACGQWRVDRVGHHPKRPRPSGLDPADG